MLIGKNYIYVTPAICDINNCDSIIYRIESERHTCIYGYLPIPRHLVDKKTPTVIENVVVLF